MKAFARLQETEFNGDWLRASNNLISNLVYDVRGLGHDQYALVLERNAFFPGESGRRMRSRARGKDVTGC